MVLKRCKKGHYYDGDKYQKCPHCLEENQSPQARARHLLKRNSPLKDSEEVTMPLSSFQNDSVTMPLASLLDGVVTMPQQMDDPVTVPLASLENHSVRMPQPVKASQKSDPAAEFSQKPQLTVGWLVCIKGKDLGLSFTIKNGKNYIGRSAEMDIALHKDNEAVKEKHVVIYYIPKQKKFVAEPGGTRDLFYLNGEVVLNPVELKKRDVIKIGNTSLMFVPFCGEDFNWDNTANSMRGGNL